MTAHLVYDSLREAQPVGARLPKKLSRHALYEVGGYCVDLLLEFKSDERIGLIGQVMNRQDCKVPTANVIVELMSEAVCVAQTNTNEYGEFRMDFESAARLHLRIQVDATFVEVPLTGANPVRPGERK